MKGSNSTKTIFILIIVILILLFILGLKVLNSNNTNFEPLSAEIIREKILSGLSYNNYTITYKDNNSTTIKMVKDNIIVVMEPSTGVYGWSDCDTKVSIAGNTISKKYLEYPIVDESLFNKHFLFIEDSLDYYGDNLYHIKNERYNKKDCIVFEAGEDRDETYWIDAEMGFVLKYEATDGTKAEFKFELDNVTDEDVKKPKINNF